MSLEDYKFIETKDGVDYYINNEGHKVGVNRQRIKVDRGMPTIKGSDILNRENGDRRHPKTDMEAPQND